MSWKIGKKIKPILIEGPIVSEVHKFGGTVDAFLWIDNVPTLLDIKTSKTIYTEHITQLAAYSILLGEYSDLLHNEYSYLCPEQHLILRVGRNSSEGFEVMNVSRNVIDLHVERFLTCLKLYKINRKLKDI